MPRRRQRRSRGLGAVARTRTRAGEQARLMGQELRQARRYAREGRCGLALDMVSSVVRREALVRCYGTKSGRQSAAVEKAVHKVLREFERSCVKKG